MCINTQIHPLTAWGWAVESGREKGGYGWVHPISLLNSLQICLNSLSGMSQSLTNKLPILSFSCLLAWTKSLLSWQCGTEKDWNIYIWCIYTCIYIYTHTHTYWDYNYKIIYICVYTYTHMHTHAYILEHKHSQVLLQTWRPTSILPLLDALSNILAPFYFEVFSEKNFNPG